MFVKQDDDYDGECFPRSYKYRFDTAIRSDPTNGGYPTSNTLIKGANGSWYDTPDVDYEDVNYDYFSRLYFMPNGQWYFDYNVGYFPLFDLTNQPGPWRLVLSDDDKDYQDFSRRQQSDFAQDIQTYNMSSGSWNEVYTGFTTTRKSSGSSDDPIRESGVRRITESNVNVRGGYYEFQATKFYSGGSFSYTFSLRDE